MFNKKLIWRELEKYNLDKEIKMDECMRVHTSWKTGGMADFFCIPPDRESLKKVLFFALDHELPIHIIGNGSNVLVSDQGIRGLVVKIASTLDKIKYSGKIIKAGAGILLPALVRKTVAEALTGLEFAAHIPGTLGGAIVGNASFASCAISDIVEEICILDYTGNIHEIKKDQITFFYRGMGLNIDRFILLEANLNLHKDNENNIISRIKAFYEKRKLSQPTGCLTAGCIFKNPKSKPAGYLIEKSGLKGLSVGDAQISQKHANFIVNKGNATSNDILRLIEKVEEKVEEIFGIILEREIKMIGFYL